MTIGSRMSYDASYVKARKKAVKQLKQNNAQQLEMETKKMEDRIRALKEQMVREKEEREKLGGTRWTSGKTGPLNSHAQDVLKKKSSKSDKAQRKIKLLGDEPLQSYIKKATPRVQQSDSGFGALGCGQCEKTKATVVCVECSEKYCVSCFMTFHQKGALKKHSTKTLEQYEKEQLQEKEIPNTRYVRPEQAPSTRAPRVSSYAQARSPQADGSPEQRGGSLLEGSYNEDESSQSFAEALKAWRGSDQEGKLWTNPASTKGSSRDSGTTPEPAKPVDLRLNFGPNKSLSYLDRMVLKKHHGDSDFTSQPPPPEETKQKTAGVSSPNKDSSSSPRSDNELGVNYREIFQSLGVSSTKKNPQESSKNVVVIEEVNEDEQLSGEESTACIVEEEDTHPHPQARPVSRFGGVSIMCMTPTGKFEADADTLLLEDVSKAQSPVSKSPYQGRGGGSLNASRLGRKTPQAKERSESLTGRVWSPKPCCVGLSEFFLAGVQGESPSGRTSQGRVRALSPAAVKPDRLSKSLLAKNVWKPQESVIPTQDSEDIKEKEAADRGTDARSQSPRPVIPLVNEPALLEYSTDRPDSKSTAIPARSANDAQFVDETQIHDFGIVDFLKARPYLPKGYEDYSQVHRVSTVSPLTLSPNPPRLHWSDDSDDEFLEPTPDEEKEDQEADDCATLNDLAWELASTTGRLTQCEFDDVEMEGGEDFDNEGGEGREDFDDEEGVGGEDFDDDSIESNDHGSGLSSSEEDTSADTYSANVHRAGLKDETTLAQEEVHALK